MPTIIRKLALFAASFLALAGTAHAEVTKQDEEGFVVRETATVAATPYETWQALIAPGKWWDNAHTWSGDASNMYISAQGGGCFCELLPEQEDKPENVRRGSAQHMVVLFADPPRALRMRGGLGPLQGEPATGVLTITLKPVDGGTRILWEYVVGGYMRYKVDTISLAVDGVLAQQLGRLVNLLGPLDLPEEAQPPAQGDKAAMDAAAEAESEEAADKPSGDVSQELSDDASDEKAEIVPEKVIATDEDVGAAIDAMAADSQADDEKPPKTEPDPVPR